MYMHTCMHTHHHAKIQIIHALICTIKIATFIDDTCTCKDMRIHDMHTLHHMAKRLT